MHIRVAAIVASGLGFAAVAASQSAPGHIRGTITDAQGGAFPVAFIAAKRQPSGPTVNGTGGAGTPFNIDVPAGTYDISVNVPGMKSFSRIGLVVGAGETVQLDVRLEDTVSLRTLGEDPTAIVTNYFNRPDPPKGPTPRLANGKPDLSGVWLAGPLDVALDLQPWAEALLRERVDNHLKDWPPSYCQPAGAVPFFTGGFFKLVHHPSTLVFMVENATGFTQMLLDGRRHPPSVGPNWLGHSVGTWDGDTLVVDAIGFRDRGWLNFEGQPHSDKLHVTERLRRPDVGHLEIEITLEDQGAFRKSWTGTKYAALTPDVELQEYVCNENNRDAAHMVGK
jgi:Carboxypeptidase regulatory-like domain